MSSLPQAIIRPATVDDTEAWADLRYRLWPQASLAEHRSEIPGELANPGTICFIALIDQHPAGFAELSLRSVVDGCSTSPVAYLEGIYVEPDFQRQGLARRLVEAGEQWARSRGCTEIGSDAEIENEQSVTVHARLGFEEVDRVVQFRKDL